MSSPRRPGTHRATSRPASDAQRRSGSTAPGKRTSRGSARGGSTGPGRATPTAPKIDASNPQGTIASMLTWRTAVIVGVLILAFAVVAPAVRAYLDQQAMLDGLRADAEVAQQEVDDLNAEVARWDDPAYLEAQARERLTYVYPGETPYRVVDPEIVEDPAAQAQEDSREAAAAGLKPWYDNLWDSMTAGATEAPAADEGVSDDDETVDDDASGDESEPLTDVDFGG